MWIMHDDLFHLPVEKHHEGNFQKTPKNDTCSHIILRRRFTPNWKIAGGRRLSFSALFPHPNCNRFFAMMKQKNKYDGERKHNAISSYYCSFLRTNCVILKSHWLPVYIFHANLRKNNAIMNVSTGRIGKYTQKIKDA